MFASLEFGADIIVSTMIGNYTILIECSYQPRVGVEVFLDLLIE